MNRRRLVASLVSAMTLVVVLVAWVAFAPTKLGGQVAYVIVDGNSMEPGMHRGDLAVVRRSHTYTEGDIVTYRHPDIGPVIHRIIGREGERYLLKGDHNSFVDGFEPLRADFIGKLWFHVPLAGRLISPFQERRSAVFLLFVAMVTLGGGVGAAGKSKNPQRRRPDRAAFERRTIMRALSRIPEDVLVGFGAATLALLVLAVFAFTRPASRQAPDDIAYTQAGTFSYTATTSDGAIYDSAAATTGDPIFRRLSDSIVVRFGYAFATERPVDIGGVQQLVAEVSDAGGWKRTIELQPPTPFHGTTFISEGELPLAQVDTLIQRFEADTGIHSPGYTVTIAPRVELAGTLGSRAVQHAFAPRLTFKLDPFQLAPPARTTSEADPFAPSEGGVSRGMRTETNAINLLFINLSVPTARSVALVGLGLVLASAGGLLVRLGRTNASGADVTTHVRARYGLSIVDVRGAPVVRGSVIDVASLDSLARVAAREGSFLLREVRPGFDAYFVQAGPVMYRYQVIALTSATSPRETAA